MLVKNVIIVIKGVPTINLWWKMLTTALVLVLVKCYDKKMVKAAPHLFHPLLDSALGS